MRVVVDAAALEALCSAVAVENKFRREVAMVRSSVRAEPKVEEVTKVAAYEPVSNQEPVAEACTFAPRRRSATTEI